MQIFKRKYIHSIKNEERKKIYEMKVLFNLIFIHYQKLSIIAFVLDEK